MAEPKRREASTSTKKTEISQRFCEKDADLIISSEEGVLFKVHRKNLSTHSEAFPDDEISTCNEIVPLTEKAATLELLFQYMYPQPQPNLEDVPFDQLSMLAEAVEKYRVFSAMEICRIMMKSRLRERPLDVFHYAARHGYNKISDSAVPLTLDITVKAALDILSPTIFAQWVLYRERWIDVVRSALSDSVISTAARSAMHKGGMESCELWHPFYAQILSELFNRPGRLLEAAQIFQQHRELIDNCHNCQKRARAWQTHIDNQTRSMSTFSASLLS